LAVKLTDHETGSVLRFFFQIG